MKLMIKFYSYIFYGNFKRLIRHLTGLSVLFARKYWRESKLKKFSFVRKVLSFEAEF